MPVEHTYWLKSGNLRWSESLPGRYKRCTLLHVYKGQNCGAVSTNKGSHRDAFLNERCEATEQATEPRAR